MTISKSNVSDDSTQQICIRSAQMKTELVTALTHTNHGNISSLILTPKQLRPEIAKIRDIFPLVALYRYWQIRTDHSYTNGLANSTLKKSQSTWFKPHQNQSHNQPYNQDSEV
ncbi:hypothetical protein EVAR_91073_1 [Eumeta japonica]|uniref:Uncharacterized protein n=1 Tax=Eumeta variegata TaxID=151549 RepID=A0A4C2A9R7_EUMVA|nr:hypothetical protein EVAR_91073_1 [Eumeta japonica]